MDNNLHNIWRVSCLFATPWWLLAENLRPIKSLNNDFNCKFHPSKAPPLLFGQNFLTLVGRICKWCILDTTIAWKAKKSMHPFLYAFRTQTWNLSKKFTRPSFRAKEFYTLKMRKSRLLSPAINSKNASLSVIWPSLG